MPVSAVTQRTRIEPDHVYVISPKSTLQMLDGHLDPVARPTRERAAGGTIDTFFETLANAHSQRAACIVLSGSGSDGTAGVKCIKARGGVTFAQAPEDAEYDSMPRSAIASGVVDFVMPAADIPARLGSIWRNARAISLPQLEDKPTPEDVAAKAEDALRDVLSIVRARTGNDFSQYKRATLLRRIERRMQVTQLRDLPSYRDFMRRHVDESRNLLRDLLISVTSFFRDPAAFASLEQKVIPLLFRGREHGGRIRAWVVGCATGEEVYSVAMLLTEQAHRLSAPVEINVFATDIDEEALAFARHAFYPESIAGELAPERLRRFFVKEQGGYRVQKSLREMVMFASHNVMQDPPFSKVDLVVCRNLLIYVSRHVQGKILDLLHFALRPEGFLFLGMSESVDDSHDGFAVLDKQARIYQQQPRARIGMTVSTLPVAAPMRLPADIATAGRRLVSYGELHQRLLEHYAPPSLVVDERYDIVHLSENAGRFLQIAGGEPTLNLFKVLPEELRYEVRSALDQAMQTMRTIERANLVLRRGPQTTQVDIRVHPVREKTTTRTFALVMFDEVVEGADDAETVRTLPHAADKVAARLEERLHDTQAQLRAAVEQYEIQNEELKASNEELQATNEELRATSEELETGKEELQSINEELTTVNQELKNKVDETTRISDDLENFINATEFALLVVDRELRIMRFTPFAREIFNLIATDVGRPLLDVTHRLAGATLEQDVSVVLDKLQVVERELSASDGRWYIQRIHPYRTKDDRIGGVVLSFIDITDRKQADLVVQRSRSWLQLVVDSVTDYAILTLDASGHIDSWNVGAQRIFGYTAEEAIGQPFAILFLPEEREAGTPENELRTAREAGRAEDDRWQQRKDGTRFFASGVTAPLHDVKLHGYVKLLRDLTEQQLAQQRREQLLAAERQTRSDAEQASRTKDEFVATLSHELRNPLAVIQMQSQLLLRSPELKQHPKLLTSAQVIDQMVRTQAQFVEDMLDVSRARTGKLAVERQLVPLPYIVADAVGALRDVAEENDVRLEMELEQQPMIVEADAVRVKQVAWNLLSNAIKFTPRGGRVRISLRQEADQARLDVEDDGQGIASDVLPFIFDWFRQGDSSPTRRKGGLGIGLALVKQLVELHGGRVEAASEGVGKGARFTVWLPMQAADARRLQAPSTPAPLGERLRGLRILVIDDIPANAEALRELLQLEGADARLEVSAHDAIRRTQNEAVDVIISDVAMPEIDGYTLLERLRESTLNANTPAIAYSGYGGADEVRRSKAAGFAAHLTKPVDVDRLIEVILEVCKRPPEESAPSGSA
jgi:two-component system CheB/CheR fusion protein